MHMHCYYRACGVYADLPAESWNRIFFGTDIHFANWLFGIKLEGTPCHYRGQPALVQYAPRWDLRPHTLPPWVMRMIFGQSASGET